MSYTLDSTNPDDWRDLALDLVREVEKLRQQAQDLEDEAEQHFAKARSLDSGDKTEYKCSICKDRGFIESGNNDFHCSCSLGAVTKLNVCVDDGVMKMNRAECAVYDRNGKPPRRKIGCGGPWHYEAHSFHSCCPACPAGTLESRTWNNEC